eukprot:scaffold97187_cov55-Phaeocystis_antarctica.AAC.1
MEPLTSAWVQSDVEYSPFPDPYLSAGIVDATRGRMRPPPPPGKERPDLKGPVQASAVRRSERLAKAGSNMLISAVPPFGRLSGTR